MTDGVGTDGKEKRRPKAAWELFHEAFPYYLSLGMTYEEYWEMDSSLVIAYREAERIRTQRNNFNSWLAGRYIYDALCCASPIFHDLARPGTKAHPYLEKPYEFETGSASQSENERKKQRGLTAFRAIAARFNRSYQEREAHKLLDQPPIAEETDDARK